MNLISTNPDLNPYSNDIDSMGFLSSDPAPGAPRNVDMADPDSSSHPGFLQSLENAVSVSVDMAGRAIEGGYNAGKKVAGDVVGGAEGIVHDVVNTGTGAITSLAGNFVLILAVAGVALVLIARSGAIKATL